MIRRFRPMTWVLLLAAALTCQFGVRLAHAEESPVQPLGKYDPEESCKGPVATPVCAYKTWFFCRIAGLSDMCKLVLGKGDMKNWEDHPWVLPLSKLMDGPLALAGYAFIGTLQVDEERLASTGGRDAGNLKRRLLGSYEVMDTYVDPQNPAIAFVGSEFYAESAPGKWRLVGWSLSADSGDRSARAPNECDNPAAQNDDICKLRVDGIRSWAEMIRAAGERPKK